MKKLIFLLVPTFLFMSCDPSRISEKHADIDTYWRADSLQSFVFDIPNENEEYNLLFYVRNGVDFPHSNLYFKYFLKDSLGATLESELVNFQLFHAKTGYPLGNGVGDLFEHEHELLTKYRFPYAGKYKVSFQQYMRYDSLPEIYSVGYRLEKTIEE
ncbi:MAG: gliding motility lipoprotein GldH [Cyclobacteriaceae bacterium]|nr:gliding motility lipoprotein GldH [Cyclobacteriaceae bacterium]